VLASPAWFWKSTGARLARGHGRRARVEVLGADGKLYIIAQSIDFQGRQPALLLRDARGIRSGGEPRPGWDAGRRNPHR